jgi:hypothetical protein
MKRLLAALIASIALCVFAVPASAQTGAAAAPTTAPKTSTSKKSKAKAAPAPAPAAAAATVTCPAGKTMVKGYTKKDGTVVKPYCRKS